MAHTKSDRYYPGSDVAQVFCQHSARLIALGVILLVGPTQLFFQYIRKAEVQLSPDSVEAKFHFGGGEGQSLLASKAFVCSSSSCCLRCSIFHRLCKTSCIK